MPDQLEDWKEKSSKPLTLPATNQTVAEWRDAPDATQQVDFDPKLLSQARNQNQKLYLNRFDKPTEIGE